MERLGPEELERQFCRSDLVALVNWTMIPAMSRIWERALEILEVHGRVGPVLL